MTDDREMWLSARALRRCGDPDDPEWDDFVRFLGIPHLREVRSIDSWCNPCVEGNYPVYSWDELWERLELLSPADPLLTYHLLFTDALAAGPRLEHPQLKLLGYDLSDETWTSSLLNCGQWQGVLEPIARRRGENGLLGLEDAQLAQALLPEVWRGDPHSHVTVWALFEVVPSHQPDLAKS